MFWRVDEWVLICMCVCVCVCVDLSVCVCVCVGRVDECVCVGSVDECVSVLCWEGGCVCVCVCVCVCMCVCVLAGVWVSQAVQCSETYSAYGTGSRRGQGTGYSFSFNKVVQNNTFYSLYKNQSPAERKTDRLTD